MARMTVEFPDYTTEVLEKLAKDSGTTKTEIIKRAIATYKALKEQELDGSEIQLVKGGEKTRVILPG